MTRQSEAGLVTGIYRHHRNVFDTLSRKLAELNAKSQATALTPEEANVQQQLVGAVAVLKPILDDLNRVRPVNQSALNL